MITNFKMLKTHNIDTELNKEKRFWWAQPSGRSEVYSRGLFVRVLLKGFFLKFFQRFTLVVSLA